LWGQKYERFGIDEARGLIGLASLKNYKESVFLIVATSVTTEAQQALLKLFEEPQPGTTFVLVVPPGILLPTLRSRMQPYPGEKYQVASNKYQTSIKFLKSKQKERSGQIAELLKDEDDTKERVRGFVDGLEVELHKKLKDKAAREGLADLALVRDYLRDRSPSLKMLLEHLALSLPTF
jgi:hypothetical protein